MKKLCLFLLAGLLTSSFVFGDDAVVLPQGVFRFRAIPSYSMLDQGYDKDGKSVDSTRGSVTVLSGAFELGVTPTVTLGAQWAPGFYMLSSFDRAPDLSSLSSSGVKPAKLAAAGLADIQIGAKFQLVGVDGFLKSEQFRVSLTPGVQVPLDAYDAKAEAKKALAGDTFRATSSSEFQALGFGGKADVDYLVNEMFFVNLHGEARAFLPNDSLTFGHAAANQVYAKAVSQSYADTNYPATTSKTVYGLQSKFELEPHAKFVVSGDTSFNLGVPLTYEMSGENKVTYNGSESTDKAANNLSIGPNCSFFTVIGPLPVEFELQYSYPLLGTLTAASSTLSLQIKVFGKLF